MAKTRGRTICDALKQVRQQIADANGIKYSPRECHHEGECRGTCPACEAETDFLELNLRRKFGSGFTKKVAGLALSVGVASFASCTNGNNENAGPVGDTVSVSLEDTTCVNRSLVDSVDVEVAASTASSAKSQDEDTEIIEMGEISGKSYDAEASFRGNLWKYLGENVIYPASCEKDSIQGRVVVKFDILPDGSLDSIVVMQKVDPRLDAEVVRVVRAMPKWNPAKLKGEPVKSTFELPVTFRLPED